MSKSKKNIKRKSDYNLIQTDIVSGLEKLKELSNKRRMMSRISNSNIIDPIVITISDDDSDIEGNDKDIKRELDESDATRDDASVISTPIKCTDAIVINKKINIIGNTVIKDGLLNINKGMSSNDNCINNSINNVEAEDTNLNNQSDNHKIDDNIIEKSNICTNSKDTTQNICTPILRTNKNGVLEKEIEKSQSKSNITTPTKYKKIIKPKEDKKLGINESFLKINQELILTVLQKKSLKTLLDSEEIRLLEIIQNSDKIHQYVSFKLFKWLPKWYRLSKFVESNKIQLEDKEIVALFHFLKDNNIVETDYTVEDTHTLLNLLHYSEVDSICKKFKIRRPNNTVTNDENMEETIKSGPKSRQIDLLLKYCNTQKTLLPFSKSLKDILMVEIKKKMGKHVIKIKENFQKTFNRVYILVTYTNSQWNDITKFFRDMSDDARIDFPDYDVQEHIVFYSPSEFNCYVEARNIRYEIEKEKKIEKILAQKVFKKVKDLTQDIDDDDRYKDIPHLRRFSAHSVYISTLSKMCETSSECPEDTREWLEYLIEKFPKCYKRGDWYFHLSRTYVKLKDNERAAKLIKKALKTENLTELQIQNLADQGRMLVNKKNNRYLGDELIELLTPLIHSEDFPEVTIDQKTVRGNLPGQKRKYVNVDSEGCKVYKNVEIIALDYYVEKCGYTHGEHCEGSIIMALFALFFWDIIYNPDIVVPGSFLSKIQTCPLDMFTPYFYTNRKGFIEERLKEIAESISNDNLLDFCKENFKLYSHKKSFCDFSCIKDETFLETIVECIGREVLSKIFERLVKDIRQYRSGMPDLLIWDDIQKKAKFVEVKGENDRLSVKQKMWLKYLKSIGANIEVCYVHSKGSKKKLAPKKEEKNEANKNMATNNVKIKNVNKSSSKREESNIETEKVVPRKKKKLHQIKKMK